MGSLTDTAPHAYEKYFEWAKVPDSAAKYAAELPNTIEIIAVAPVSVADYKKIFAGDKNNAVKSVTEAQRKEIEDVQVALKTKFGKDQGDRDFDKKDYKRVLQGKSASFVVVIGHNENGMLHLLDGSELFLDEIVAVARPNQRIILISCDSENYVSRPGAATINRKVTYNEAFELAGRISGFIKTSGGPVSPAEIQEQLTRDVTGIQTKYKIAFFIMRAACVVGTAIVVALIIRELDPCKDGKDAPGCPQNKNTSEQRNSTDWEQRVGAGALYNRVGCRAA